ncbi:MAG: type I DNA topoisomerase [Aestuariivita sp.]|nr:type I DNA topoisomerase [Aestuariivita sp.]
MPVVIVESPAKAKTINKYLGKDFIVLASFGHVRDLPAKDGSVDPDQNFAMSWEVASDSRKHVKAIADALAKDQELILATDPDREGEAISWHLQEALAKRRAIKKNTSVRRVTFNAITQTAVKEAMANPRDVDMPLVSAYLARRALDYLVGFTLSPVLWRKLPGAKSAGRVQSVSLRLIVEREMKIEAFKSQEYWSVTALLTTPNGQEYEARLSHIKKKKLGRYDIKNESEVKNAVTELESHDLFVTSIEAKPVSRNPSAPFMTSTLQQEASRKFGMGTRQTMRIAQQLYEAGHITYMRTDGIDMAPEAVKKTRETIELRFGGDFVSLKPRIYKNKAKNAQEAHECIRPTDVSRDPKELKLLDNDQFKLYDLIWKRTIACQMASAKLERTTVDISSKEDEVGLRATGQVMLFEGFLRIYEEGRDDTVAEEDHKRLPIIKVNEPAEKRRIVPEQHFTQPPPRYTEATLVKAMEELGIGRPSTYASIVTTIQDREYVRKEKGRLHPEDKGRLVTVFLKSYFSRYVGYDFTASLEEELDDISAGNREYTDVLARFWKEFSASIDETSELRITDVLEKINDELEPHLFPPTEDGKDPRLCPECKVGRLSMRTARSGSAFIGCSNYPECRYTRPFGPPDIETQNIGHLGKLLGHNNEGEEIRLFKGRFGPYVQRGTATEDQPKPVRISIPERWNLDDVDLNRAINLLNLPRKVGPHPEDGVMIEASIGRYGPYIRHGKIYVNIKEVDDIFTIGINRAVNELAQKSNRGYGRAAVLKPIKELGDHPKNGGTVNVIDGRYGPYVKWNRINATLPKDMEPASVTMEIALELLDAKASQKISRKRTSKRSVSGSGTKQ